MQAVLPLDDPTWNRQRHRLAVCMAISACAVFAILATLDWPPRFDLRLIPLELEITLRDRPGAPAAEVRERPQAEAQERQQPEARPLPQPATPTAPATSAAPATPATPTQPAERAVVTEPPAASAVERPLAGSVDWYVELERVAAEVDARAAAEPQSMHPEFDELRRIAAWRYSKPLTNEPSSTWAEEHSYMIREDPGLVNRYVFGTFDEHMIQFAISFGRPRPKNLPWVEIIRARYDYLDREPDELPVIKSTPAIKLPE